MISLSKIRERITYFITHKFFKNFAILQVGNMGSNIIQAVVGIALARILQPEYYGIYALVFSLAGLMSIFMGVGAQDAVTTILGGAYERKDEKHVHEALAFLAKITAITGVIVFISACFAPLVAKLLYHNYLIGVYAAVIMIASIISTTAYSFSSIMLQVVGKFKVMTALSILDTLARALLALTFVLLGYKVFGIVVGHLMGSFVVFVASLISWNNARNEFPIIPKVSTLISHVPRVSIRKYIGFSFWIAIDRNLANLYNILPVFLTGVFILPGEVPYFKLAFGYMNLATSFLSPIGTLLNVEFPKMQVHSHQKLARNFVRVSLYSFALSTVVAAGAAIASPIVFRIIYGTKYLPSIPFVFGLFFYGAILGLGIGLGSILRAMNRVMFSIRLHIITLTIGIPLGLFLIKKWGLWGTVILVSLWYVSVTIIAFFYVLHVLRDHDKETKNETVAQN
ncbi:MAG: oligosaccharide flippase family protein [Candidatus Pacebacteria bacterium]|nr:oligosaccharide flippase family protein [Candidatus Paceibacterota bacterium]